MRNLQYRHAGLSSAAATLAVVLLASCANPPKGDGPQAAPAMAPEDLDAISLIAAMPDGVESVMLIRSDPDEPGQGFFPRAFVNGPPWDAAPADLQQLAAASLRDTRWRLAARGGSDFEMARGVGVGNSNDRLIAVCDEPLAELAEQLRDSASLGFKVSVHRTDVGEVYESPCEVDLYDAGIVKERRFLAMPSDRVVVVAETLNDAVAMVRSLQGPSHALPDRWSEVASDEALESPFLVLRDYPAGSRWLAPAGERAPPGKHRFALWLGERDERSATLFLRATPPEQERWAAVRDFLWHDPPAIVAEFRPDGPLLHGKIIIDMSDSEGDGRLFFTTLMSYGITIAF